MQTTPVVPSFGWHGGFTVGGGMEYWATPELSTRIDYRYTTYDKSISFPFSQTETFTVRGGLEWHLGAGLFGLGMPQY